MNKKSFKKWTMVTLLMMLFPFFLTKHTTYAAENKEGKQDTVNITLHKVDTTESIENNGLEQESKGDPVKGAGFTVYDVTDYFVKHTTALTQENLDKKRNLVESGLSLAQKINEKAINDTLKNVFKDDFTKVKDGETNEKGIVAFNALPKEKEVATKDPKENLGVHSAVYLVVETKKPLGVTTPADVMLIALPIYDKDDKDKELTDIHVYPKNEVEKPNYDKKIEKVNGTQLNEKEGVEKTSVTNGDTIQYKVTVQIPKDIKEKVNVDGNEVDKYNDFLISDHHSALLTDFQLKSIQMGKDDETTPVTFETSDYNIDQEKNPINIHLTTEGIGKLEPGKQLIVTYTMAFTSDETEKVVENIKNTVSVPTIDHGTTPPKPSTEVYTGGIHFKKVDAKDSNKGLKGATFIVKNKEGKYFTGKNWSEKESDAHSFVSGENGLLTIAGLSYDTGYALVETKAPKGYVLPKNPKVADFNIDEHSFKEEKSITEIKNTKPNGFLPSTGGSKLVGLVAAGIVLIGVSGIYFKKRQA